MWIIKMKLFRRKILLIGQSRKGENTWKIPTLLNYIGIVRRRLSWRRKRNIINCAVILPIIYCIPERIPKNVFRILIWQYGTGYRRNAPIISGHLSVRLPEIFHFFHQRKCHRADFEYLSYQTEASLEKAYRMDQCGYDIRSGKSVCL